ncbi:MAG: hypothetical protein JXR34_12485 [Bacteroidales bacterium]|nr:hypothetical protein [Bacteroidales bacterium]
MTFQPFNFSTPKKFSPSNSHRSGMNKGNLSGGQHVINRRRKPVVMQCYNSPDRRAALYQTTSKQ